MNAENQNHLNKVPDYNYMDGYNQIELKRRNPIPWIVAITVVLLIAVIVIWFAVKKSNSGNGSYDDKLDLGRKYISELNYGQAIAVLKEAINIDPKNRRAYIVLAELYAELGDDEKVDEVMDQAEATIENPDDLKIIERRKKQLLAEIGTGKNDNPDTGKDLITDIPKITDNPMVAPEVTVAPENTSTPEVTVIPDVTDVPESTITPEVTVTPEITDIQENVDDSEVTVVTDKKQSDTFNSIKNGSLVEFGHYEQDGNTKNGKEPIEWIVLSKDEQQVFLLSKYALDAVPYNEKRKDITWENCSLRKWLNDDFYEIAFTDEERNRIKSTKLKNDSNPSTGRSGGNDTKDKVFILSLSEISTGDYGFNPDYNANDNARQCPLTTYAYRQGAAVSYTYTTSDGEPVCCWWLRTPGDDKGFASVVCDEGYVADDLIDSSFRGIRPAIVISLQETDKNDKDKTKDKNEKSIKVINKEADAAYIKLLKKICKKVLEDEGRESVDFSYCFKDINGDGVHEAMFVNYRPLGEMMIYSYSDGKTIELLSGGMHVVDELHFYLETKSIKHILSYHGRTNHFYYQMKKGEYIDLGFRKVYKEHEKDDGIDFAWVYYDSRDNEISKAEFKKLEKKYCKGTEIVVDHKEFKNYTYPE